MSDSGDLFDTIQDRLDTLRKGEEKRRQRLLKELASLETELLLADALAALRLVSTRNMSEGQRHQLAGLRKRITQALGRAA